MNYTLNLICYCILRKIKVVIELRIIESNLRKRLFVVANTTDTDVLYIRLVGNDSDLRTLLADIHAHCSVEIKE